AELLAARPVARQFRAAAADSEATRSDADAGDAGTGALPGDQPHREDAGGPEPETGVVASDVVGVSGRAMLNAIVKGETDSSKLAELAKGTLRNDSAAPTGAGRQHHRTPSVPAPALAGNAGFPGRENSNAGRTDRGEEQPF